MKKIRFSGLFVCFLLLASSALPALASAELSSRTLKYGDISPDVRTLQQALNSIGKNVTNKGEETTRFGEKTLSAIKALQCEHSIACSGDPSHGVFGPRTRELLISLRGGLNPRVLGATTDGLIGHWAFDGNTNDGSGNGRNGTAVGGPTYATGKIGQAMSFDGSDDYVDIPDIIEGLGAVTVSSWVKTNDLSGKVQRIIKQTGGGDDPIMLDYASGTEGNDYKFRCVIGTGATNVSSGNTAQFRDTNWHHVACVYNGTDIRVYVDGSLSNSPVAKTGTLDATTNNLVISSDVAGDGWSGNLDDFRIYNRALTASEISDMYNLGGDVGEGSTPVTQADTVAPAVSITSPASGATVSGSVNISATASDAGGISDVQFKLDGNNLNSADATSPYGISWNTAAATNGTHILTATARDAAGNQTTSSAVTVTVSNAAASFALAVTKSGTGSGTITSSPPGINFGTDNSESFDQGTSVTLTATPATGSTFAGWSGGGCTGMSPTCVVTVFANTTVNAFFSSATLPQPQSQQGRAWSYPAVPYTDWAYDPFTHVAPARPAEWPNAAKQNYYFIAPNDANATDTVTAGEPVDANGKRFGYPNKPRKTLPMVSKNFNSYPAGTVFWMKGGEYNTVFGTGEIFSISSQGTADNPFWIYGDPNDKPVFRNARILIYNSSYGFIENINFDDGTKGSGAISFGRSDAEGDTHHITVRNIDIKNRRYVAHGGLISVDAPGSTVVNGDIHDIVFYKIYFKNNGRGVDWDSVDADMHGYKLNGDWNQNRAYRIWIIENDVRKGDVPDPIDGYYKSLAGNFIQVGDQLVTQGNIDHVWIAGNYSEGTRQGCVGLKRSGHVVVSSNTCRDLAQAETSQGQAFNIKYDRQENLWFVNNYVENVDSFIIRAETTSSGAGGADTFSPINTRVHIIGNVFKNNMRQPWNAPDMGSIGGWKTKGISIQDMNGKVYIANNVIDTSVYGVYFSPHSNRQSAGSEMHVYNNIAVNLSAGLDTSVAANNGIMVTTDTASEWFIENNLVDSGRFYYSGTQYNSAAAFNARLNASGNKQGDPMFANPNARDYSLLPGSPAIDAGISNYTTNSSPDVYQLFINAFANDRDFPGNPSDVWPKDKNNNPRFLGSSIDIGAYESGGAALPPRTDTDPSGSSSQNTNQTNLDPDQDGVPLPGDLCPNTPFSHRANVNRYGCIRPRINASVFDIGPDLNQDIRTVINLRLGKTGIGEVRFQDPVTLVRENEPIDIDANLIFSSKKIELRSAQIPELNKRAVITLYGITETNPKIMKDGVICTTCMVTAFDRVGKSITFAVPGFSTYEIIEGDTPPVIVPIIPSAAQSAGTGGGGGSAGSEGAYTTVYGNGLPDSGMGASQVACSAGQIFNTTTGQRCTTTTSSVSSPVYSFIRNLTIGAKGEDVRQLQIFLNNNGFTVASVGAGSHGNETTTFGPATRAALARYQAAKSINPPAGYFGPVTRASVNGSTMVSVPLNLPASAPVSSGAVLKFGSSGLSVKALRMKLRSLGYFAPYGSASDVPSSAAAETSFFGATTEAAVKKYQCDKNIVCSGSAATTGWGSVGASTRASLGI